MKISSSILHTLGGVTFAVGILLSTLLTVALTWAPLEGELYGFPRYTTEHFDGLTCPRLMARSESGIIQVAVHNPSELVITPFMTIDLSTPALPETEQVQATAPPGQTSGLKRTVTRESIDRGFFIFVKAIRSASYPVPTAEALCGILVLNDVRFLNGGTQILSIWLALCLLCTPLGLWLWSMGMERHNRLQGVMKALAVAALGGLLVSMPGLWMPGMLALTVTVLLAVGLLRLLARV